jgi:phosphohistidine phosphatase SixA
MTARTTDHPLDSIVLGGIVTVRDRLLELQAQGRTIYRLESGNPSFSIPDHVSEAIQKALRSGLALAVLLLVVCAVPARAQEAIYIVRHAERASDDPQSLLSAEGHTRAARLGEMLRDAGITAVFVTEYERTVQTAQPAVTRLGLTPIVNKADDTPGLVAKVRALGPSARVLIAGHSDTVPKILAALGCATPVTIAKGEFDNLFIVMPGQAPGAPPLVLRLRY